jgi:hypothetical protein
MIKVTRTMPRVQPDYTIILNPDYADWLSKQMDIIVMREEYMAGYRVGDMAKAWEFGRAIHEAKTEAELKHGGSAYE